MAGNVCLGDSTRNALSILEALGRSDVGVWPGSEGPAEGVPEYAYHFHGETGLTVDLGDPVSDTRPGSAVDLIVESARLYSGSLELMAIGPLTNIADALDAEPELPGLVHRLWIMGGALHCPGNVTPRAEFNFYSDPHAAGRVLNSEMASTLIGLDVCGSVQVGPGVPRFPPGGSVGGALSRRLLAEWLRSHPGRNVLDVRSAGSRGGSGPVAGEDEHRSGMRRNGRSKARHEQRPLWRRNGEHRPKGRG